MQLCSRYNSHEELEVTSTKMLLEDQHNSQTYNLVEKKTTQKELPEFINFSFRQNLSYKPHLSFLETPKIEAILASAFPNNTPLLKS